jgi:hypothetical protein
LQQGCDFAIVRYHPQEPGLPGTMKQSPANPPLCILLTRLFMALIINALRSFFSGLQKTVI